MDHYKGNFSEDRVGVQVRLAATTGMSTLLRAEEGDRWAQSQRIIHLECADTPKQSPGRQANKRVCKPVLRL
jgi:hypothetical protein